MVCLCFLIFGVLSDFLVVFLSSEDKLWNEGKIAMHLTSLHGMTAGMTITDYQKASQHVSKDAWNRIKNSQRQTEYKFYMGCFYSPSKPQVRRRVDIKFYPYRERAFAMLYFTGNGKNVKRKELL